MEYSEKYGTDVDEAVRLALEELGLREDQVMVTVLEESSKGFLGLGTKLAKVRVEKIEDTAVGEDEELSQADVLAAAEKPQTKAMHDFRKKPHAQQQGQGGEQRPQERSGGGGRDGRDGGGRDGGGRDGGGRDGGRYSGKSGGDRDRRDNRDGRNRDDRRDNRDSRDRDRDSRDRDKREGDNRDYNRRRPTSFDGDIDIGHIERISEPIENLVPDPENEAMKFFADMVAKMGLNVQVEGFKNDECNYIEVKGNDSRVVIGKRGQTLDALQYLTNLVSNKGSSEYKRVIIDVEGYRSRREKTLEQLAVKLAKKVLSTGRNARLEPMNPYERKVIHATLQHVDGIMTKSEGEEPYRRVIIEKK